jgi:enhancing lycopene biosynthesis protein 2
VTAVPAIALGDIDALVVPGGYGVTKNLCDYAFRAHAMTVQPDVARLMVELHKARKPMAFLCTAPLLAARVLGAKHPTLTMGRDAAMSADIAAWGAVSEPCGAREIVVDRANRIVSTPAFLTGASLEDIAHGIERAVRAMLELR